MAISAKSLSLLQELKDRLSKRTSLAVGEIDIQSTGASLQVGTGVIGSQSMFIRALQIDPIGFDGIGLAARGYAQTVIQVAVEATAASATTSLLTSANTINVLGEVLRQGSRVELYMSANGVAPVAGTLVAGNLKATWEPDLQYRTMDAQ